MRNKKPQNSAILKIMIGLVVFILGMTMTFSSASGINIPNNDNGLDTYNVLLGAENPTRLSINTTEFINSGFNDFGYMSFDDSYSFGGNNGSLPVPPQIPEPGTILLLLGGLGVLRATRRN